MRRPHWSRRKARFAWRAWWRYVTSTDAALLVVVGMFIMCALILWRQ